MATLNYINNGHGLKSWLLTKDHKRIALLYLAAVTMFFFIGGLFAFMIRLELLTPSGDLVVNELNTMPGFTPISMFPKCWIASGVTYPELISELIDTALERAA